MMSQSSPISQDFRLQALEAWVKRQASISKSLSQHIGSLSRLPEHWKGCHLPLLPDPIAIARRAHQSWNIGSVSYSGAGYAHCSTSNTPRMHVRGWPSYIRKTSYLRKIYKATRCLASYCNELPPATLDTSLHPSTCTQLPGTLCLQR